MVSSLVGSGSVRSIDLMGAFGRAASSGYDRSRSADLSSRFYGQEQEAPAQNQSMLMSLNGEVNSFKVHTTPVESHRIKTDRPYSGSQVEMSQKAMESVGADVGKAKAAIGQVIEQAQKEVMVAMKESGIDPAVFVDTRIAAGSVVEAVSSKAGPIASVAEMILTDLRDKPGGAEVLAKIEDYLRSNSPSETQVRREREVQADVGQVTQPAVQEQAKFNWNSFFDNGYELETLMGLDPEDPSTMQALPEWNELDKLDFAVADVQKNLDEAAFRLKEDALDSDLDTDMAMYFVKSLDDVAGATVGTLDMAIDDVGKLLAGLSNEPDPNTLSISRDRLFSNGLG